MTTGGAGSENMLGLRKCHRQSLAAFANSYRKKPDRCTFRRTRFIYTVLLLSILASLLHVGTARHAHRTSNSSLHGTASSVEHRINALARQESAVQDFAGVDYWEESSRSVLLINGTADDSFSLTFYPETGLLFSDYDIQVSSSNPEVLNDKTDVDLTFVESGRAVNISANADFHGFPGQANLTIDFRRQNDSLLLDSLSIEYLAAGVAIFRRDSAGIRQLYSGTNRTFVVSSYSEILESDHYEFGVFVQYLNGSSSDDKPRDTPGYFTLESLRPVLMKYRGHIEWDDAVCKLSDASWNGTQTILREGCGMGFAFSWEDGQAVDNGHFCVEFERYRAGSFSVLFEWDEFTEATEFDDERYTTYCEIVIGGSPPAVIREISPSNSFSSAGNQTLYVETINAENAVFQTFTVQGVTTPFRAIPGTFLQYSGSAGFYESVDFRTEPGTGKLLDWSIQAVRYTGSSDPATGLPMTEPIRFIDTTGFKFSYDNQDVQIFFMGPDTTLESGGIVVTIVGVLAQFDETDPSHNILFSNHPIDKALIKESNDTAISFDAPSRLDVGSAWTYDVGVQIGAEFSNTLLFTYAASTLSPIVTITGASAESVDGSSYSRDSDGYTVGECGNITLSASLRSGGVGVTYLWKLMSPEGVDILSLPSRAGINNTGPTITFGSSALPEFGVPYTAILSMHNDFGSGQERFVVRRSPEFVLGVSIVDVPQRTVSQPAVSLRLVAKIDMPTCFNGSEELTYVWDIQNSTDSTLDELPSSSFQSTRSADGGDEAEGAFMVRGDPGDSVPAFSRYVYSSRNLSVTNDGEVGTTRLGRELAIPMKKLKYGSWKARLTVLGSYELAESPSNQTDAGAASGNQLNEADGAPGSDFDLSRQLVVRDVQGIARSTFTVVPSAMVVRIRDGETRIKASVLEDLVLSGKSSYDPDVVLDQDPNTVNGRVGMSFKWTCGVYNESSSQPVKECPAELWPEEKRTDVEFSVPSRALQLAREDIPADENWFLQYNLTATKENRTASASQVVEVVPAGQKVAIYKRIDLLYVGGENVDSRGVRFWEEVILQPVIPQDFEGFENLQASTEWSFSLVGGSRSNFFSENNLLEEVGYYRPREAFGSAIGDYQRSPLGIKSGALAPNTVYNFVVEFMYSPPTGTTLFTEAAISFRTLEKPRLLFPEIDPAVGTSETIFAAHATSNVDDDSMYMYQFYLIDTEGIVPDFCLDGCTGAPMVHFSTYRAGVYVVQARLMAANGKIVLDVSNNTALIETFDNTNDDLGDAIRMGSVSAMSANVYSGRMEKQYRMGDDGGVNHRAHVVSTSMSANEGRVLAMSSSDELCVEYMAKWVNMSHGIATRELPVTANAKNYIELCASYASVQCIEEDEEILYALLDTAEKTLQRTPQENTLQMRTYSSEMPTTDVIPGVQRLFNYTITRAVSSMAKGTTRTRLAPNAGEVKDILLALYEKWREHVLRVATSGRVCGWEDLISSEHPEGVADTALVRSPTSSAYPLGVLGVNQIKVAVKCNREHGKHVEGSFSRFSWGDELYQLDEFNGVETRKLVSLAELPDYVYLSGIQGENKTDSKRLVWCDISVLGASNYLVSAMAAQTALVSAQSASFNIPTPNYTILMEMHPSTVEKTRHMQALATTRMAVDRTSSVSSTRALVRTSGAGNESSTAAQGDQTPGNDSSALTNRSGDLTSTEPGVQAMSGNSSANDTVTVYSAFALWPTKRYEKKLSKPFQDGAYRRHMDGVYSRPNAGLPSDSFLRLASDSYVTIETDHLGLFGAIQNPLFGAGTSSGWLDDIGGTMVSLAALLVGILLLVLIITGLTYMLASTIFSANAIVVIDDEELAEQYVERDFFGRGQIRLNAGADDGATESSLSSAGDLDGIPPNAVPETPPESRIPGLFDDIDSPPENPPADQDTPTSNGDRTNECK